MFKNLNCQKRHWKNHNQCPIFSRHLLVILFLAHFHVAINIIYILFINLQFFNLLWYVSFLVQKGWFLVKDIDIKQGKTKKYISSQLVTHILPAQVLIMNQHNYESNQKDYNNSRRHLCKASTNIEKVKKLFL